MTHGSMDEMDGVHKASSDSTSSADPTWMGTPKTTAAGPPIFQQFQQLHGSDAKKGSPRDFAGSISLSATEISPKKINKKRQWTEQLSSWWFQPIWKNILVKLNHFPRNRDENKT